MKEWEPGIPGFFTIYCVRGCFSGTEVFSTKFIEQFEKTGSYKEASLVLKKKYVEQFSKAGPYEAIQTYFESEGNQKSGFATIKVTDSGIVWEDLKLKKSDFGLQFGEFEGQPVLTLDNEDVICNYPLKKIMF